MALIIGPQEESVGGSIGKAVGGGLSNLLGGLAQGKAQTIQRQGSYRSLLQSGVDPQSAMLLSNFSSNPEIQAKLLEGLWQRGAPQQQGGQQQGGIEQLSALSGQQQQMQQGQAPQDRMGQQQAAQQQPKSSFYNMPLRERREEEKLALKKQQIATQENAPWVKNLDAAAQPAKSIKDYIGEAKKIISENKDDIQYGWKSLSPGIFQNAPTQALVSLLNQIVLQKAQLGKGVPTKMRLALEEASKPALWQKPETVDYLLNVLEESVNEPLEMERIKDKLIEKNFGLQPRGLENQVKKYYHKIKGLPSASEYSEDAIIEAHGKKFARNGDQWEPLD